MLNFRHYFGNSLIVSEFSSDTNDKIRLYNFISAIVGSVLSNGPGDLGSIQGRVILKTLKMVLDTSLLNT